MSCGPESVDTHITYDATCPTCRPSCMLVLPTQRLQMDLLTQMGAQISLIIVWPWTSVSCSVPRTAAIKLSIGIIDNVWFLEPSWKTYPIVSLFSRAVCWALPEPKVASSSTSKGGRGLGTPAVDPESRRRKSKLVLVNASANARRSS